MKVVNMFDTSQEKISEQLSTTEKMISLIGEKLTGKKCNCQIIALEDLGFSNNIMRMVGGFYTGMFIEWDCNINFIPVDATINSCGVSIFELTSPFLSYNDFLYAVKRSEKEAQSMGVKWNFNSGNHFISLSVDTLTGKQFLIIHASDNDYKFGEKGLYPREDTWYYSHIQSLHYKERYIRYIHSDIAEKFYDYYLEAQEHNPIRNDIIAELISNKCAKRILYTQHYGMPSHTSIAIGCQWKGSHHILLTSLGKNIYIIANEKENEQSFFPHGFGSCLKENCKNITYRDNELYINGQPLLPYVDGLLKSGIVQTRFFNADIDKDFICKFLDKRNFRIISEYKQIYSYNEKGFRSFAEK